MENSQELDLVKAVVTSEIVPLVEELDPGNAKGLENSPAAVYLASLRPSGRRTMLQKLNEIAQIASPQSINNAPANGEAARSVKPNAFTLHWHELRYQHTAAI